MAGLGLTLALVLGGAATAEPAKSRQTKAPAAAAASAPQCARANYPGDPVCAWEDDGQNLPTPSAHRRGGPDDVVINDSMSVGGADDHDGQAARAIAEPYPTRKEPVGGGAAVNYRF
ncbi:MAG: hypothetical protein U1E30_03250 [Rhodoblastus sp.]